MDELAAAAGSDPLDFRLKHLDNDRLRAVLREATDRFGWQEKVQNRRPDTGVGLACGTEKGSYVAACVEITIDRTQADYRVPRFRDLPELDIHLLNRPDLPSAGGGETPIIALAPAIANAVFHATGQRIRQMPIRLPG